MLLILFLENGFSLDCCVVSFRKSHENYYAPFYTQSLEKCFGQFETHTVLNVS